MVCKIDVHVTIQYHSAAKPSLRDLYAIDKQTDKIASVGFKCTRSKRVW